MFCSRAAHRFRFLSIGLLISTTATPIAWADIFRLDDGQIIPDTEGITPGPGVQLDGRQLEYAELNSLDLTAANFENSNLTNAHLSSTLLNARLSGTNLTNAYLGNAVLTDANLAGAIVFGTNFVYHGFCSGCGQILTKQQLYSTASYQQKNLQGIVLSNNDLTGWDLSGQDLTGADLGSTTLSGVNLQEAIVNGIDLGYTTLLGFTKEQLYSTASYQQRNLRGVLLSINDLTGWDLSGQDLSNAGLVGGVLTDANLAGAIVAGAAFGNAVVNGLTQAQLYSTASYQQRQLHGIDLNGSDLSGWHLSGQDLTGVNFTQAKLIGTNLAGSNLTNTVIWFASLPEANLAGSNLTDAFMARSILVSANLAGAKLTNVVLEGSLLTGADLTAADLRGTTGSNLNGADVRNAIRPDGRVLGLDLADNEKRVVHDDDGRAYPRPEYGLQPRPPIAIAVHDHFAMSAGGVLRLVLEADAWDSVISFEAGIPVELGGTLELAFADGVDLATQVGRTLRLFDWSGVSPVGTFAVSSPYTWDVSNLYRSGEVTLLAVPEPTSAVLALLLTASLSRLRSHCRVRR